MESRGHALQLRSDRRELLQLALHMAASFVLVKRVLADEARGRGGGEVYAELELRADDTTARLAARACREFPRWGVDAGQVQLFLVAAAGVDEPDSAGELAALSRARLQAAWPLASAGVGSGAWLLARVPPPAVPQLPPPPPCDVITRAEAQALVAQALLDHRRVERLNPLARTRLSEATSPTGSSAPSGTASMRRVERRAFKASVAAWYGLDTAGDDVISDMLGVPRRFDQVTLAHIWPESYGNFSEYASEMALPGDFHLQPRNFLLLSRDVHDAFDAGKLGFVPAREGHFTVRVFRREGLPDGVASLDGVRLHLPRALEGHVPYRRSLGWFAWLAKGAAARSPGELGAELEAALEASESSSGNAALKRLVQRGAAHFGRSLSAEA